ncbi:Ig-like domain-containing protein [Buttiauxella agrestis]
MDKTWLHEGDNNVTVNVQVTDDAGNRLIPAYNQVVTLDSHADATITVNSLTADNTINALESKRISVTGQVDGDAKAGDTVTLEVNGHTATAEVKMMGNHLGYEFDVKKDWVQEGHNNLSVSVSVTDNAGNHLTTPPVIHPVYVDTKIDATIALDPVTPNHVINASAPETISVTGQVGGDVKEGDHVEFEINHHTFSADVELLNGQLVYKTDIEKKWLNDGDNILKAKVTTQDHAGNVITKETTQHIQLDTHADAKITINNVTDDNHIDSQEARHHLTHITGQIDSADVHDNEHINVTINHKHYDVVLHEENGHLTYDVPVNTHELNVGKNSVNVSVIAHDDHGNSNVIHQESDFTMDDPSHRGKHDVDTSGKTHHATHGHDHGLSNLFDDSNDSLSFNLNHDAKAHSGRDDAKVFTGKDDSNEAKHDLSSLAKELHENPDITHHIRGGDDHGQGKGLASAATHLPGAPHAGDAGTMHDSGGSSHYSLDHLIAKPEHYSH